MKKMRHCLLFILLHFSWAVCDSQGPANDRLLAAKLDSVLSLQFENNGPGGSVFIQQGKRVLYSRSFGLANLKTGERFTQKTVSNIGSITKTFVAYGILILQKQGKLSIDDNLLKYFPDFKNKQIAARVKIRHLLTHTSGLPDNRQVDRDSIFYLTAKDEENFAPLKQGDSLAFEPGTDWAYSNPAYNGLALIIEKLSGMKWQAFIDRYIFKTAGMVHSKITDGSYPQTGVAHGYRKIDGHYEEYDYGEYPTFAAAGNGGVWSSVDDLKKYVHAIEQCLFLDCQAIKFSKTVWHPDNWKGKDPPFQGFSWVVGEPKKKGGHTIINHSGGQGGFRANLYMIPDAAITIIWLNNNDKSLTRFIMDPLWDLGYIK